MPLTRPWSLGTFEGLVLPYLFKNFGGAPPAVATAATGAPVVVKEKKEDKNSGKAGAAAAGGKATTAKTVAILPPPTLGVKNFAHAALLALTLGAVFWTEQGGVNQCRVGVYPSAVSIQKWSCCFELHLANAHTLTHIALNNRTPLRLTRFSTAPTPTPVTLLFSKTLRSSVESA